MPTDNLVDKYILIKSQCFTLIRMNELGLLYKTTWLNLTDIRSRGEKLVTKDCLLYVHIFIKLRNRQKYMMVLEARILVI